MEVPYFPHVFGGRWNILLAMDGKVYGGMFLVLYMARYSFDSVVGSLLFNLHSL
jgi:hypothetical protein